MTRSDRLGVPIPGVEVEVVLREETSEVAAVAGGQSIKMDLQTNAALNIGDMGDKHSTVWIQPSARGLTLFQPGQTQAQTPNER